MFQNAGVETYWQATFLVLGGLVVVCIAALALFVPEVPATARLAAQAATDDRIAARLDLGGASGRTAAWLAATVSGPFMSIFRRNGLTIAVTVLGFIFLFKIGEAFLGRMSVLFYWNILRSGFRVTTRDRGTRIACPGCRDSCPSALCRYS